MPSSAEATVEDYLAGLPEDRRAVVTAVRDVVNANLPPGYREGMQYGMIGWAVPHDLYPAGYHADPAQPLPLAALASQKRCVTLHLMGLYLGGADASGAPADREWFEEAWRSTGRKLDMGASCVRFRTLDDVPLDVVAEAIGRLTVDDYITRYEASPASRRGRRSG